MKGKLLIKVCGLVEQDNLLAIDQLRVQFLGINFYEKSQRFIGKRKLPKTRLPKVGVFVNATFDEIMTNVKAYELQFVQLHGNEPIELAVELHQAGVKIIKCFGIEEANDFDQVKGWEPYIEYVLFDTKTVKHGGTGVQFDWNLLKNYTGKVPFLLAGGVGSRDVDIIKEIKHEAFAGLDINSRFEERPGIKKVDEIKLFVDEFRS